MKVENRRRLWAALMPFLIHIHTVILLFILLFIGFDSSINKAKYSYWSNEIYLLFTEGWIAVLALFLLGLFTLVMFYLLVWRLFFNDFIQVTLNPDGSESEDREGRVYWINNVGLSRRINDWLEIPINRRERIIYFNAKGLFNIFFPLRSLFILTSVDPAKIEKDGLFKRKIYVEGERIYLKRRFYTIRKPDQDNPNFCDVPINQANRHIREAITTQEERTKGVVQCDAELAKEQNRGSMFSIPMDLKKLIQDSED